MLYSLFWILIGCIVALAAMQLLFIIYYRRILQQPSLETSSFLDLNSAKSASAPKVAIVLCLRGPDPTLADCITGLLKQHYPNFELHLVVDCNDDPVIPIATSALQAIDSAIDTHWHTVVSHGSNCSLKCSALVSTVMALESQNPSPEIVAFVDADALVDPDWLSRLVAPLVNISEHVSGDESNTIRVGATTGNRWFEPIDSNLGSRFRAVWNAAALPQMQIYQVAWGGSLAIKLETIRKCNLLELWSQAFCEDTMLTDVLRDHGLNVQRVPELIVVNQESTELLPALDWIGRQLLTVRLHHRAWSLVFIHALLGGFCFFTPLAFAMVTANANQPLAIWAALAWCVQLGFNIGLLEFIRMLNIGAIKKLCTKPSKTNGILSKIVVAVALQAIYPFLAIRTAFKQRVNWRGIDYKIGRNGQIEMLNYVPYAQVNQANQHSIH